MTTLTERSAYCGAYTAFAYHVEEDTGNSKQTLLLVYRNDTSSESPAAADWAVVVGSWELRALRELAGKLLASIAETPEGFKTLTRSHHSLELRLIQDSGWKLHINFTGQAPAAVSMGTDTRWRIYPGELHRVIDLLSCLEQLDEADERVVGEIPFCSAWLVSKSVLETQRYRSATVAQINALHEEIAQRRAVFEALEDDAGAPLLTVLSAVESTIGLEVANCKNCKSAYLRSTAEYWKTTCLACWNAKERLHTGKNQR